MSLQIGRTAPDFEAERGAQRKTPGSRGFFRSAPLRFVMFVGITRLLLWSSPWSSRHSRSDLRRAWEEAKKLLWACRRGRARGYIDQTMIRARPGGQSAWNFA
jgi:hypothetical protein